MALPALKKRIINPTADRGSSFGATLGFTETHLVIGDDRDWVFDPVTGEDYRLAGAVYLVDRDDYAVTAIRSDEPGTDYHFGDRVAAFKELLFVREPGVAVSGKTRAGKLHVFDPLFELPLFVITEPRARQRGGFGAPTQVKDYLAVMTSGSARGRQGHRGAVYIYRGDPDLPDFGRLLVTLKCPYLSGRSDDSGFNCRYVESSDELLFVGGVYGFDENRKDSPVFCFDIASDDPKKWRFLRTIQSPLISKFGSMFGYTLAAKDGVLFVGAHGLDAKGKRTVGGVFAIDIDKSSGRFGEVIDSLIPSPARGDMRFGWDLAVYGDQLFVGALTDSAAPGGEVSSFGNVYVYSFDWQRGKFGRNLGKLERDSADRRFGHAITVVDETLVVAAEDGETKGSVSVYELEQPEMEAATEGGDAKVDGETEEEAVGIVVLDDAPAPVMGPVGEVETYDGRLEKALEEDDLWEADGNLESAKEWAGNGHEGEDGKKNGRKKKTDVGDQSELDVQAREIFEKAVKNYRRITGNQSARITIHSGKRSTRRQAELYREWLETQIGLGGPNRANKPGKSMHEYGLAIDIVRAGDEVRLGQALREAGWEPTVEDEGWHWEATSVENYGKAVKRRKLVLPLSDEYGRAVSDEFSFAKLIRRYKPIWEEKFAELKVELAKIRKEEKEVRKELVKLRAERERLEREKANVEKAQQGANRKFREYQNYRYTFCPNKYPYNRCQHGQIKARFDREKQRRRQAYQSAKNRYDRLARQYRAKKEAYDRKAGRVERQVEALRERKRAYSRKASGVRKLERRLREWERKRKESFERSKEILARIEQFVGGVAGELGDGASTA